MRSIRLTVMLTCAVLIVLTCGSGSMAKDYNSRFIRNYPPGYYGMYYNAERFFDLEAEEGQKPQETYRWDKFMSRITDVYFPFLPIPYDWEYGNGRTFGLPDYNTNDWP